MDRSSTQVGGSRFARGATGILWYGSDSDVSLLESRVRQKSKTRSHVKVTLLPGNHSYG